MQTTGYVYAIELLHGDQALPAVRVTPDFAPAVEAARFAAFRAGTPSEVAFVAATAVVPRWDDTLGEPYLAGLTASARAHGCTSAVDVPLRYFGDAARAATASLVQQGALDAGDTLTFRVTAYRGDRGASSPGEPGHAREAGVSEPATLEVQELAVSLDVRDGTLRDRLGAAQPQGTQHPDDVHVFMPASIVEDAMALASTAEDTEAGAFLVGHVRRDTDAGDVFVDVTDLLPARHTQATVSTLTFTPDTWWDARAALTLRSRGESFLGWVHTHPVSAMCRRQGCSPDAQRQCPMARDFFSEHDRLLHRTMFPRAHTVALVVNDWDFAPISVSLFGYRHGLIEPRGFHVIGAGAAPHGA